MEQTTVQPDATTVTTEEERESLLTQIRDAAEVAHATARVLKEPEINYPLRVCRTLCELAPTKTEETDQIASTLSQSMDISHRHAALYLKHLGMPQGELEFDPDNTPAQLNNLIETAISGRAPEPMEDAIIAFHILKPYRFISVSQFDGTNARKLRSIADGVTNPTLKQVAGRELTHAQEAAQKIMDHCARMSSSNNRWR